MENNTTFFLRLNLWVTCEKYHKIGFNDIGVVSPAEKQSQHLICYSWLLNTFLAMILWFDLIKVHTFSCFPTLSVGVRYFLQSTDRSASLHKRTFVIHDTI